MNIASHRPYLITAIVFLSLAAHTTGHAEVMNYNSIMLGDRAGGMGGAFTALTDDPAASPFYNPATLARLTGSSLSTAVTLFNKYDTSYGTQSSLDDSIFRINKGTILSIPSASAIVSNFHNFSAGLTIVLPEYQNFGGTISNAGSDSTFLRLDAQSVWVGGTFALNVTEKTALGFSAYYTSDSLTRSSVNQYAAGGGVTVENEALTLSTNSIIYEVGGYHELNSNWRLGVSYRFPSILVSGTGSYLFSSVSTVGGASTPIQATTLQGFTHVPDRLAFGVAFVTPHRQTYSFDITSYGGNNYSDLNQYGDSIVQKAVLNFAFGFENYVESWLALRLGVFTDNSAAPAIPPAPTARYQDHIDKLGFSANLGIQTTAHTKVSIGGYYVGGTGETAEKIGANFTPITKTDRVFSFLVGSAYNF